MHVVSSYITWPRWPGRSGPRRYQQPGLCRSASWRSRPDERSSPPALRACLGQRSTWDQSVRNVKEFQFSIAPSRRISCSCHVSLLSVSSTFQFASQSTGKKLSSIFVGIVFNFVFCYCGGYLREDLKRSSSEDSKNEVDYTSVSWITCSSVFLLACLLTYSSKSSGFAFSIRDISAYWASSPAIGNGHLSFKLKVGSNLPPEKSNFRPAFDLLLPSFLMMTADWSNEPARQNVSVSGQWVTRTNVMVSEAKWGIVWGRDRWGQDNVLKKVQVSMGWWHGNQNPIHRFW